MPPRKVPAHHHSEVECHLLKLGIITQTSNPWMAPAVFAPKKLGELHFNIDYRELNKQKTKDAYTSHYICDICT